jgi:hypothetical protein
VVRTLAAGFAADVHPSAQKWLESGHIRHF